MKLKRWIAVVGAGATMGALTGCPDKEVRDYLGASGEMVAWQRDPARAVCHLETAYAANPGGLTATNRICPNGEGGGGDNTTPPKYPPR